MPQCTSEVRIHIAADRYNDPAVCNVQPDRPETCDEISIRPSRNNRVEAVTGPKQVESAKNVAESRTLNFPTFQCGIRNEVKRQPEAGRIVNRGAVGSAHDRDHRTIITTNDDLESGRDALAV